MSVVAYDTAMRLFLYRIFHGRPDRIRALILFVISAVGLLIFEEVADDVFADPREGDLEALLLDRWLAGTLQGWRSPFLNQAMTDLTALGSFSVIAVLSLIVGSFLLMFRDRIGLAQFGIVLLGAAAWPGFLKGLFLRPRPDAGEHLVTVLDASFPSGHAFGAMAVYVTLALLSARHLGRRRREGLVLLLVGIVVFLVGLSRIYLGVHYPTDVFAGFGAGLAWATGVAAVISLWRGPSSSVPTGDASRS